MIKDKITSIWRRLTEPHPSLKEPEHHYQAQLITSMMLILFPIAIIGTVVAVITSPTRSFFYDSQLQVVLINVIPMLLAYWLSRSKHYTYSVFLVLFFGPIIIYFSGYAKGTEQAYFTLYHLSILVLIGGFMLSLRLALLLAIFTLLSMPFYPLLVPAVSLRNIIINPFIFMTLVIATTLLISHYRNRLEQNRQQRLTQLLDKLNHQTDQLTTLHETTLDITSHRNMSDLLHAIVSRAAKLLHVAGSSIYLVNKNDDTLTLTAAYGLGEELQGIQLKQGEGLAGRTKLISQPQNITNYAKWPGRFPTVPTNLIGGIIQVPIISNNNVIGVLSCLEAADNHRTFTSYDIRLLERLARQSALALQNATLLKEEQVARVQAQRLQAAMQALSSSLELQDVLETILTELQKVVPYDSASVQKFADPHHLEIIGGHGFPNLDLILGSRFDLTTDDSPNRHVIESRAPFLIDNAPAKYSKFNRAPFNKTIIRSWLGVPLLFGNQIKGMLALDKREFGFFTQEHAHLVSAFAAQAAIAIENARLYEETRRNAFELETLSQISTSLRTAKTVPEMMPILLQETVGAVDATYGVLFLVDQETGELVSRISYPPGSYRQGLRQPPKDGITGHVATTREIYISDNTAHDPRLSLLPGEQASLEGTQSSISIPVQTPNQLVGVMHIASTRKRTFTEADVRLLTAVSNIAANALERAAVKDTLEERVTKRTQELAQANAQLKELDTLKTKFISDISHELRTPVATLNLYMDLLEQGNPEKKPKYMQVLRQKTDLLVRLTEDILNVSRLNLYEDQLKFTAVNLNKTIATIIAMHQERAQAADITLTFTPAPNLPPVYAEQNQLMQAVTAIVSNALHYTPSGSIQVHTSLQMDTHQACLQISDTGIGIESDEIPYIFDRFYRGRQVSQSTIPGTGLGLSITKEIVDLHNGSIEVESELGQGTTIRINWPLASEAVS